MEESRHHHHHHHHHHHDHADSHSSDQQAETVSQVSEQDQQQSVGQRATAPVQVPRSNQQTSDGVQAASSFHSVSSIDSSAEMAKYFPDAETPSLSPFSRQYQDEQSQPTQSAVTSIKSATTNNAGPYITVPAPARVQPQLPQPVQASVTVPQQQAIEKAVAPQLPPGIPAYSLPIEGLSVSETIVNDIIIDLQTKVINETQQQYYDDFSSGSHFEQLPPIYIRAPNPSIILRSDLHRLRAQLNAARPSVRHAGSINQFQVPSFPPPH